MARFPEIIKNTFVYTFFNAMTALIPFFLLPILTRYLSPTDYGTLSIFAILVFFFGPLLRIEMVAALRRFFFEDRINFAKDVGCSIAISSIMFLLLFGIWAIAAMFMDKFLEVPMPWVLASIVVAFGASLTSTLLSLYQVQNMSVQLGIRSTLIAVLVFGPTVILVAYYGFDWRGRAITQLAVSLLIEIPTSLYLIHRMFPFQLNIERDRAKRLIQFGLPLVPVSLASYLLLTSDRLILGHLITLEAVGLYSVAVQIVSAVRLLMNSFITSWETWLYATLNQPTDRNKARIVLVFYGYSAAIFIGVLGIIFVLPHILPWLVGDKYISSYQFLGWLAFSEMFKSLTVALQIFLTYKKKTGVINYILMSQVAAHVLLTIFLVKTNGAIGAAQASLVSSLIAFVIAVVLHKKYFDLPWLKFLSILSIRQKGVGSAAE